MGRNRARAAAVVIGTTVASVAYAQLAITSNPATTQPAPVGTDVYVVVSIRNTSATATAEIDSITPSMPQPFGCTTMFTSMFAPIGTSYPVLLAPGQQAQFGATAQAATMGSNCPFDVTTAGNMFDTTFSAFVQVSATPNTIQVQPLVNNFGTIAVGSSEDQYIYVENLGTSPVSGYTVDLSTTGAFTFPACGGGTTCPLPTIGPDAYQPVVVRCAPTAPGPQSGMVMVHAASALVGGDMTLMCAGGSGTTTSTITVAPKPSLDIMTAAGVTGSGSAMLDQTGSGDTFIGAMITGTDASYFDFHDPVCMTANQTCAPTSPVVLPYGLKIECTPDSMTRSATLTVHGNNGSADVDSTLLNCIPSAGGPHIVVTPLMITAPSISVGQQEGPYSVLVQNTGGGVLTVTGSIMGTGSNDWTADNCIAATCSIAPSGSTTIGVTFAPQAFGNRDAQLVLDNNDTTPGDNPQVVNLYGSASGGVLAVTQPASGEIMFGTLPRNQLAQQPITAANKGNATIDVVVAPGGGPFQASTTGFSLVGGATNTFQAGCMSATPGSYDSYVTLTAANAYTGSPAQVHVTCTIAPTDVQVTPTSFDFGEVRIHTAPVSLPPVTVTNPTSGTVHVTRLALDASRAGLSLSGGFTSDMALAPGQSLMATLTLTPDAEVDLAGVNLAIDVDGVSLSFPITGKVVTPHSSIMPTKLDLGTVCVGAAASGVEMLVNDGTATLAVQAPMMDQSFVAMFDSPTAYPAMLAPGDHAATSIRPMSSSTAGPQHGTLSWSDDVPNNYSVDVDVDFISSGTALSPSALSFGAIDVNAASPLQEITLQNCDPDPVTVAIVGVEASQGRADAWMIAPAPGYMKTLAAHDKLTIDAQFVPRQRGVYQAKLKLTANGSPMTVTLSGSATSQSLLATDFYACTCNSQGSGGWPIALAIALVTCRRRRGSSSPR